MIADPSVEYHLEDVDLSDVEFVKSLTERQFQVLLLEANRTPAAAAGDLAGPSLLEAGDAVLLLPQPNDET